MKFRGTGGTAEKIEIPMTPMIDVVFLLLIFFMLTFKIIEPEGDFNINMPIGAPSQASPDTPLTPPLKVRMIANADGSLGQLLFNQNPLGNGEDVFKKLNDEILRTISQTTGNPLGKDVEVEIDADYDLNYEFTIHAISASIGRIDKQTQQIVRYVEKVKFAPPRRPGGT